MHVLKSIIDPATAPEDKPYVFAFVDDDWDHWDGPDKVLKYRGWRSGGRWHFSSLSGDAGDWTYTDDEIIVLAEWEQAP